jgi:hypothetical protein
VATGFGDILSRQLEQCVEASMFFNTLHVTVPKAGYLFG